MRGSGESNSFNIPCRYPALPQRLVVLYVVRLVELVRNYPTNPIVSPNKSGLVRISLTKSPKTPHPQGNGVNSSA